MTKLETIIYAKTLILAAKSQNENAFDVIIESLDKQMPKKPIKKVLGCITARVAMAKI